MSVQLLHLYVYHPALFIGVFIVVKDSVPLLDIDAYSSSSSVGSNCSVFTVTLELGFSEGVVSFEPSLLNADYCWIHFPGDIIQMIYFVFIPIQQSLDIQSHYLGGPISSIFPYSLPPM